MWKVKWSCSARYWPTLILFKSCGIMISSVSYNTSYPFIHPSILTIHMLKNAFICSNSPDCDNSANDVTWHPTCWGFFCFKIVTKKFISEAKYYPELCKQGCPVAFRNRAHLSANTDARAKRLLCFRGEMAQWGTPHLIIGACTIES